MNRMKKGEKYKMLWYNEQENQYMDKLVDNINDYLNKLYDFDDIARKAKVYSNRKRLTDTELKAQYDNLVKQGYIKTQSFDNYLNAEREKNLDYDNVILNIGRSFFEYELVANKTISFLNARKEQFYQMEQTILNAAALGLPFQFKDQGNNSDMDLERTKLRFTVQQIDDKIAKIKEQIKNNKEVTHNILNMSDSKTEQKSNSKDDKNEIKHDNYETNYEKRLAKYHEKLVDYHRDCKTIVEMYDQLMNDEIEDQKFDDFEQKLEDKYTDVKVRYNNFVTYRKKILERVKKGEVWHPSLTKEDIKQLKNSGINKPEGNDYLTYLKDKGLTLDYVNKPRKIINFHNLLDEVAKKYDDINEQKFEEANDNWDSHGLLYKLLHRKEKPVENGIILDSTERRFK